MTGDPYRSAWSSPARRPVQRIPEKISAAVVEFLYGSLTDNPHRRGKPLTLGMAGLYSARRGDYRIIYAIAEDERVVEVVAIEHRSDAYRARRR